MFVHISALVSAKAFCNYSAKSFGHARLYVHSPAEMHFRIAVTVHYICDNMPDKLNANGNDVAMHTSNENNMAMLCTVRVFHTIRVWYIPYAYGTYHTRMVCFSVPYAYGCTVCVYCSTWHKAFYRDWRLYSKCLLRSKGYVLHGF